jgi:hypothetical protein
MAPPPPLIQNHSETWWGLGWHWQKEYHRVAGVSVHRFNAMATTKHESSHPKLTLCPRARWSDVISRIVNKITEELVQSIKSTLPCFDDRAQSCDVWRLHLPLKLEPLGAGGLWGPWCWCFIFLQLVGLCVCASTSCTSLWEKWSIRPLVSGPATDKSKRRI